MTCVQKSGFRFEWERAVLGSDLDGTTKLVLLALGTYADINNRSCFPGQERLAEDCSKSVSTIQRALRKARQKGFIRTYSRSKGDRQTSNLYELLIPEGPTRSKAKVVESGKNLDRPSLVTPPGPSPVTAPPPVTSDGLPAQQSRSSQSTGISNTRARMRDGGKAGHQGMTRMQEATAGRLVELWKDVRSLMGGEAPRTWSLREGSYAEMTTALAWTLFNKKLNYKAGTPIRDIAAYFVTMLRMVRHEEKTARTWTREELWQLMASDLSPDEFRKPPKA